MLLSLKNVKDGEICLCARYRFNFIIVARNIANKHFSLKKAHDPGLYKHLELSCTVHVESRGDLRLYFFVDM